MILVNYRPLHCRKNGAISLMILPFVFSLWDLDIVSNIGINCIHNDSGRVANFQYHLTLLDPTSYLMLPAGRFTALKKVGLIFDALIAG